MFRAIQSRLADVVRFDRIVKTNQMQVGEVETPGGGTALAIQVSAGAGHPEQAMALEPRAQGQLLSSYSIPGEHFDRLPRQLQAAELNHFLAKQPKEVTVRAIGTVEHATARAVVSGKYEAFDTLDVLEILKGSIRPDEWEVSRDLVGRDEMGITITKPQVHEVGARKVGDMVKIGLAIRNSEVGTMALGVEFCLWRLVCQNGMISQQAAVSTKTRHIWVDRESFKVQLRNAIQNVAGIGEAVVRQLRASHDLLLPNLNPEDGKLQKSVFGVLRKHGLSTVRFLEAATQALGKEEEASLFGLVQYLTNAPAKSQGLVDRLSYERVAGELMALATV